MSSESQTGLDSYNHFITSVIDSIILYNEATAYGVYTNQRAIVLTMFDGPEGLTVRAERAKAHVCSVYGPKSPKLKALIGKTY